MTAAMPTSHRENDIDAAATLLGFRATLAAGRQAAMTTATAVSAAPAATEESLRDQSHQMQQQLDGDEARLPPKKRRSKAAGRALPLSQRPIPAVLQQSMQQLAPPSTSHAEPQRPKISRFPQRLMEMLADETISDSIAWLPHGRSFLVLNPTKFTDEVLPRYFGACKFASFTRKLYRWGFRQISKGPDAESFFHRLFRRDEPLLCDDMICKEEIRDGCPELHGGINEYSLMRMEQADRLQELMKKNLDTKKKLDMARAIKRKEQERAAATTAPSAFQARLPEVATTATATATATAAVDLTGSPSPQLPGGGQAQAPPAAGLSRLPVGGGIGLVQRHLLRIEKRRSELQSVLRDEIVKRKTIADSKRRYNQLQLLAQQQQLEQQEQQHYQEPPHPDRTDTVAESKRRYAELLARQGRSVSGLAPTVQAQMQASPVMAPAPTPTHAIPTMPVHHQLLLDGHGHGQKKAAADVAITGTFYPSLPTDYRQQQQPSAEALKSCLKKSPSSSVSTSSPQPFLGHGLLAKHHQQQHAADLLARHYRHDLSPHSARALAILKASLAQQRKEELLGGAGPAAAKGAAAPGDQKNVVATGVINRALETLRREGFA
jgi:hypothetical protein